MSVAETFSNATGVDRLALERLPAHPPELATFARALFDSADPADLHKYTPDELAAIAQSAFAFYRNRGDEPASVRITAAADNVMPTRYSILQIIHDDIPFLLSSVLPELQESSLNIYFVSHPILSAQRTDTGDLATLLGPKDAIALGRPGVKGESFIHIHLSPLTMEGERATLIDRLKSILGEVRAVAADREAIFTRLQDATGSLSRSSAPVPVDTLSEAVHFLQWLERGNFIFLGSRAYDFVGMNGGGELRPVSGSGLGVLRDDNLTVLRRGGVSVQLTRERREFFQSSTPLVFATANAQSRVYRRGHMDSVGVKLYAADGALIGEERFVGLYSPGALTGSIRNIPVIRLKVEDVLRRAGFAPDSHSGRTLAYVLETLPRSELLQMSAQQLYATAMSIVQLSLSPRTRVLVREDDFGRFISAFAYVPRDRYTTNARERITAFFEATFGGRLVTFTPFFPEGPMVRLHLVIWRNEGALPRPAQADLEAEIEKIIRNWRDRFRTRLATHYGDAAQPKIERYIEAFPAAYQETVRPERALEDIQRLDMLTSESPTAIDIFSDETGPTARLRATLYQLDEPIELSRRVPILENLGFNVISERTFELAPMMAGERRPVFLHDSVIETRTGDAILFKEHEQRLEQGFLAIWRGRAANDGFNGLMLAAKLNWREASLMRAYASYLRQTGAPFGLVYLAQTLNRHGGIVTDLVNIFHALFDPGYGAGLEARVQSAAELAAQVEKKLEKVAVLDEDRIIRHFLNLINATLRTNFYQRNEGGGFPDAIVFKLRSAKVDGLPSPKPYAEIFVTSPRYEGVHLRGGPIARGGLRWSDRPQDFRTEVLGLAKAQNVKNTVIVPQGAKGGFVPAKLPPAPNREAFQAEGVACYKSFIANLLSVTDNLVNGNPVTPLGIVRHDGDDPYLVVAADKGTATFSDIANGIAVEKGFWLGDAFASGGSAGYDHKKMAITARGGWEAVKRHFREMNIDIQTQPFRVIGVGDMSGDVFGNGMLLSRAIKLVAAFDHRDIFIDPEPDPASSWIERKRMFDLPRSSWQDYDRAKISAGGGVFSRTEKFIELPEKARAMLGVTQIATPAQVMAAILRLDADLLWLGGIGTYVRGATETNEQVSDRANDAIRATAAEMRVKVIGEGANLGITQRARIEFALNGGRINTDAIDNSAGVNSSDYEVNIKIALGSAVAKRKLTLDERNAFMASMTDDVAKAVLDNNYLQTLAISLGERRGLADLGFQRRLINKFEASGLLHRRLEGLPTEAELADRQAARHPLTRPELAVLLAYAKINLKQDILASPVPDDPYLGQALAAYFPPQMRERFAAEIDGHSLRREIIATMLTNDIINRGGSTFAVRLTEETGHEPRDIAYAFAATSAVFVLPALYGAIDALDGRIDGQVQLGLYIAVQDFLRHTAAWFLRHGEFDRGLTAEIAFYRNSVDTTCDMLGLCTDDPNVRAMVADGVPADTAMRLAALPALAQALEIGLCTRATGRPETEIAPVFAAASDYFRIPDLRRASESLGRGDYYERLAVNSTLEAVAAVQRGVTQKAATLANGVAPSFEAWLAKRREAAQRAKRTMDELFDGGELTLAKLTLAVSHLRELA